MSNRGLTLLEILVTVAILGGSLLTILQILNKSTKYFYYTNDKLTAYFLADDSFQEIKSFIKKSKKINYKKTRLNNNHIKDFTGVQNPPENILNLQMNEYKNFTRQIQITKINNFDFSECDSNNLYEITVKIIKSNKEILELKWLEFFEELN